MSSLTSSVKWAQIIMLRDNMDSIKYRTLSVQHSV